MATAAKYNSNSDEDWLSVELSAGITYRITMDILAGVAGISTLSAFSAEDSLGLGGIFDGGRSETADIAFMQDSMNQLVFTPRVDSTYFIQSAFYYGLGESGTYDYGVEIVPIGDDFADNTDTTGVVTMATDATGLINDEGDEDWFRADLQAGVTYEFIVETDGGRPAPGLSAYSVGDTDLWDGRFESGSPGLSESRQHLVFTPSMDATFYISVGEGYDEVGAYTLMLDTVDDDYADNTLTLGVLATGGVTNGAIDAVDDTDFLKMNLAADTTYMITVDAGDSMLLTRIFSLEDSSGLNVLSGGFGFSGRDFGINTLTFNTLNGGEYFVSVTGFGDSDQESETFEELLYSLSLTPVVDDYDSTIMTTGVITPGGSASGELENPYDRDWFKAELQGGTTYKLIVSGPDTQDLLNEIIVQLQNPDLTDEERQALLEEQAALLLGNFTPLNIEAYSDEDLSSLFDSNGRSEVGTAVTGGGGSVFSQLVFTPRENSTYFFDVSSFLGNSSEYSLELTVIEDDFSDNADTSGLVEVEGQATGEIEAVGDEDWFAAELLGGVTYKVAVTPDDAGGPSPSLLYVNAVSAEDTDGLELFVPAFNFGIGVGAEGRSESGVFDSESPYELTFTPLNDATYYIQVGSLTGSEVGYNLYLGIQPDDFPDNTATTGVLTIGAAVDNTFPTGGVSIEGSATQEQLLTANVATLADVDGLGAFDYRWYRNDIAIEGAFTLQYTLTQADVGATITVEVSYVDGGGTPESVVSDPLGPVENVNDLPDGNVVISGAATIDETLTADTSAIEDADGLGQFDYQWLRDGTPIPGATNMTYQLLAADLGTEISVEVRYTDGEGTEETLTSVATDLITYPNTAPQGKPVIDGLVQEGQELTANIGGVTDEDGLGTFSYQWLRDGVMIVGATAMTYTPLQVDVGAAISVNVSYTDGFGHNESVTSDPTTEVTNVNDDPVGDLLISGQPLQGAQLLADTSGLSDEDGLGAFSYQWYVNPQDDQEQLGNLIAGATGSAYIPTYGDIGRDVSVVVTYTDGYGESETVASAATTITGSSLSLNDIPLIENGLSDITEVAIQQIFVGLLGRPVAAGGEAYWKGEVEADNGFGLTELMSNIVNQQPEYINAFSGLDREAAVTLHFNYLFARDPTFDNEGHNYWVDGAGSAIPTDQLVLALLLGVLGDDKRTLSNKMFVADYIGDNEQGLASPEGLPVLGAVSVGLDSVVSTLQAVDLYM